MSWPTPATWTTRRASGGWWRSSNPATWRWTRSWGNPGATCQLGWRYSEEYMKMPLRRALLVSALLLPLPAFAADTGPVAALRSFFTDVTKSDYADAWAAFTSRSKQGIVNSVADSEHLDPTKVRKLFDTNDPSIQAGFWENFKNSSQSGKFVEFAMATGGPLKGSDDS